MSHGLTIIRATQIGFCFGVRDALQLARESTAQGPISLTGELVHNPAVMQELTSRGAQVERKPSAEGTTPIMITAHGISDRRRAELSRLGRPLIDGTCPLVHAAHRALARLVRDGYFPVIIGLRSHVEVLGLTEDYPEHAVIYSEDDVDCLEERRRFGIVAQTTQPIERVKSLVARCRQRFPRADIYFIDTVCSPTKQHQKSAIDLAQESDVVLVIGGRNSNNTRELVTTCSRHCSAVHHIGGEEEIQESWFKPGDIVGITAGTSTPDSAIDAVENRLKAIHPAVWNGPCPILPSPTGSLTNTFIPRALLADPR